MSKHNTILYGPPATGKVLHAFEIAVKIIEPNFKYSTKQELKQKFNELIKRGQIIFMVFDKSYFIENYIKDTDYNDKKSKIKNYVLIIDEINEKNLSKIFSNIGTSNNLFIIGVRNKTNICADLIGAELRRNVKFIEAGSKSKID